MNCPILPVGDVVTSPLTVDQQFVRQLQLALRAAGENPGPINGIYGPQTAAALRAFQDKHPDQTGIDRALEVVDRRFRYASCATYRALGLRCTSVYCSPVAWGPVVGSEQTALLLCAAVATAADQGLISLSCPLPPPVPWRTVLAATIAVIVVVPLVAQRVGR